MIRNLQATTHVPPRARLKRVDTTTGTGNLLLGPPPAGFVRRVGLGPMVEGGIVAYSPVGGTAVQYNLLVNTDIRRRQGFNHNANVYQGFDGSLFLAPGESLNLDYTAGASTLRWMLPYVDYPATQLVRFNVFLDAADKVIIPTPAAGQAHVLDGLGENGISFDVISSVSATVLTPKMNGVQIKPDFSLGIDARTRVSFQAGMAIDSANVNLQLDTSVLSVARAFGAYWVVDEASA